MSIVLDGTTGITTPGLTNTGSETVVNLTTTGNTILGDASTDTLNVGNGGLIKDASGNLGVGVTPSAWASGTLALQIAQLGVNSRSTSISQFSTNQFWDGSNHKYIASAAATLYTQNAGAHSWAYAPSGTAGNAITFTQAMTLDASGNLGVGTTSPDTKLNTEGGSLRVSGTRTAGSFLDVAPSNTGTDGVALSVSYYGSGNYGPLKFTTGGSERARIDSSGNLLVGTTSAYTTAAVGQIASKTSSPQGYSHFVLGNGTQGYLYINVAGAYNWNSSDSVLFIGRATTTSRSINAAGSVNASGADYAEYMTKAGDFTVAKGDVVGIDAQGKLTNVFADAVSFVVKSTDPSYVGGDVWGNEEALGLTFPEQPSAEATDEEKAQYEIDKAAFETALEAARQRVDRIAFAGQVPVNVMGATAGQYIIPVSDNGAIKGEAVSNPTFEQYQTAVGKVIAIESDGRAKIIVKVA